MRTSKLYWAISTLLVFVPFRCACADNLEMIVSFSLGADAQIQDTDPINDSGSANASQDQIVNIAQFHPDWGTVTAASIAEFGTGDLASDFTMTETPYGHAFGAYMQVEILNPLFGQASYSGNGGGVPPGQYAVDGAVPITATEHGITPGSLVGYGTYPAEFYAYVSGSFDGSDQNSVDHGDASVLFAGACIIDLSFTPNNPWDPPTTNYSDTENWHTGSVPNGTDALAVFDDVGSDQTVTLDENVTLGTLSIDDCDYSYTITGPNTLTFSSSTGLANISIAHGSHTISAPISFASATNIAVMDGASLSLTNSALSINLPVSVSGGGTLSVTASNPVVTSTGSLSIGQGTVNLEGLSINADGSLVIVGNTDGTGATLNCSSYTETIGNISSSDAANVFQLGGTNDAGTIYVGSSGPANYTLYGGDISCSNTLTISGAAGTSTFTQTGGSIVTRSFRVGGVGTSGSAYYVMDNGSLEAAQGGYVAGSATSTQVFYQYGGNVTIDEGNFIIGGTAPYGSYATYALYGGVLQSDTTNVYGRGTLDVEGGGYTGRQIIMYGLAEVKAQGTLTLTGNYTVETGGTTEVWGNGFSIGGSLANYGSFIIDPDGSAPGAATIGGISVCLALNLNDGGLLVNYTGASPAGLIHGLIAEAYDGGAWDRGGITSSLVTSSNGLAIGCYDATADSNDDDTPTSFFGINVGSSGIRVMATLPGDANCDGVVNNEDWDLFESYIDAGGVQNWWQGDFNYDGVCNADDVSLYELYYGDSLSGVGGDAVIAPEPALGLLPMIVVGAVIIRRRRWTIH